jgi:hypothetical protein
MLPIAWVGTKLGRDGGLKLGWDFRASGRLGLEARDGSMLRTGSTDRY